jgi:glycosyltransferase involved in cell wall biosynthesis
MISVIVPVWNAGRFLPQVIEALEGQDFPAGEYEILLVDNGSTDDSVAIIHRYPRVRFLHEPRRGSYAARNRAAMEARGDLHAFIDADRVAGKGWLRAVKNAFAASKTQVLLGRTRPGNDSGLGALLADYENEKAAYVCKLGSSQQQVAYTGNMAVRRAAWEKYGPFVELQRGADVVFVRRVVDGESYGCVRFCENMLNHHLELSNSLDYFRKMFAYGASIRTYSRVMPAQPLTMDDRLRILLRCVHQYRYGPWRAMRLGVGLLIGLAAYQAGGLFWREKPGELPRVSHAAPAPRIEETLVLLAGDERGDGSLRKIAREVETLSKERRIEVIVVYFPAEVDGGALEPLVTEVFPRGMAWLLAANTGDYYELKNAGAEAATGDIVVFSDCDTHVEESWLRQLTKHSILNYAA